MELDSVLRKVRALIEKAEHPETPQHEAIAAQEKADALMQQYRIDEAKLDASRVAADRTRPEKTEVPLVGDHGLAMYMVDLVDAVARHCDCRIKHFSRYHEGAWQSKVYAYPSDLRYFQILYAELRLHMVGALRPSIDPLKSVAENAYVLHNAGMNWFDIAQMEGWKQVDPLPGEPKVMYVNKRTGERQKWADAVGKWKRGYAEEIKRRGEDPLHIRPGGMESFRVNAAMGYVKRIDQRLREVREGRAQIGNALAMRVDLLDEFFREDNPVRPITTPSTVSTGRRVRAPKVKTIAFNEDAYRAGVNQANTAGLNPATSNKPTKEIG